MMAHNGTIPNPLANLIVSLDKAGKRLQRRKEQKLDTAEVEVELRALLEQQATEDVNMAYSFAIAAVKSIKGLDGREYSGLYDDRDPDAPAATADELPLSLLPAHAINKINALLQTDIDRIMLYFR